LTGRDNCRRPVTIIVVGHVGDLRARDVAAQAFESLSSMRTDAHYVAFGDSDFNAIYPPKRFRATL